MMRGHCEEFRRVGTTGQSFTLSTQTEYLIVCRVSRFVPSSQRRSLSKVLPSRYLFLEGKMKKIKQNIYLISNLEGAIRRSGPSRFR